MGPNFAITERMNSEPKRKLTRKERRGFDRMMKKLKYQKIAKRIVEQSKDLNNESRD